MSDDIQDILEANAEEVPVNNAEEKGVSEPVVEDIPTPEPEKVPPTPKADERTVPIAALEDERRKRQEAEGKLEGFRQVLTPQTQNEENPVPDPFDDPEGYAKYQDTKMEDTIFHRLCGSTEEALKFQVGDAEYQTAYDAFSAGVESNPGLAMSLRQSGNPALFAYKEGQKLLAMQDIGDPLTFKERMKAEILAELNGDEGETTETPAPKNLPESLADEQTQGSRKGPEWTGPPSISELLNG